MKKRQAFYLAIILSFMFAGYFLIKGNLVFTDKRKIESIVENILYEQMEYSSPVMLYQKGIFQKQFQKVFFEIFPGYQFRKEYGRTKQIKTKEQNITDIFLENGGEEENTGMNHNPPMPSNVQTAQATQILPEETIKENTEKKLSSDQNGEELLKKFSNTEYLKSQFYSIDAGTKVYNEELNAKKMVKMDLSIKKEQLPQILIYHTHASEEYRKGKSKGGNTVVDVGEVLTKELEEKYGYKVYHDKTIYDIVEGKLDRNRAYTAAGNGVQELLKKYPSIEVVIDLHRDGVAESTHLVSVQDGKKMAQFMFFNGMSRTTSNGEITYLKNPNRDANLAFTFQLQMAAAKQYPGLTRKIYIRGYRYNLHFKPRCLLVEVGAQNNTVIQAKRSMVPLAKILNDVLE